MILILHKYTLCWVRHTPKSCGSQRYSWLLFPALPRRAWLPSTNPYFPFQSTHWDVPTLHSQEDGSCVPTCFLFCSWATGTAKPRQGGTFVICRKPFHHARLTQLLAEIGWQRTKVAQTKQKSRTKSYSSPLYLTLSSHIILVTSKLCESLWNTSKHKITRVVLGGEVHIMMLGFLWNIHF